MGKATPKRSDDSSSDDGGSEESDSVYDSEDGLDAQYRARHGNSDDNEEDSDDDDDDDEFEDQGSSDDEEDRLERQRGGEEEESDDEEVELSYAQNQTSGSVGLGKRTQTGSKTNSDPRAASWVHTDDLSSDDEDEDGMGNRIGRVPLHWYDEFDHIGFDAHGNKLAKSASGDGSGDLLDQAIARHDNKAKGKFVIHDMLNDRNVELTPRQLELIRRVQAGAFAHPEHDGNPDHIDYFSGVNQEISGISMQEYESKARFLPSKWEKMQVDKMLEKLEKGHVSMDYLKGRVSGMHKNKEDPNKLFMLWTGDEEDEISMRKGPTHIAAPKVPPPGHAESYVPPDEYLPTEEEKKQWEEMEPQDRPHGLLVPQKFANLRSVGAYEHAVREVFERCLDLHLSSRALKRRLNIDPESLVPRLPKSSDLKPFPNAKCVEYVTPRIMPDGSAPVIRSVTASPNGQYMASAASDGFVRLWEVETGRLLQSWDLSSLVTNKSTLEDAENAQEDSKEEEEPAEGSSPTPVVHLDWNPNRSNHCLLAAVGKCVVIIATGTARGEDGEITEALLASACKGGNVTNPKAAKAVTWKAMPNKSENDDNDNDDDESLLAGPVCVLQTNSTVSHVRWQAKGDYFVSVSPKAGAAAVLIHQASRGNSQQPFSKSKGEAQVACFHPNKPFLFVASQHHVRVYHLVKQALVKRLISGCKWISSLDVHPSGDHLVVGSLDRRVVWFDLDLSATPYKTLKYHERAVRSCRYHNRYPLLASASDDGAVHIFHSMVYNDLMRNPLIVPVKILRGHAVANKLGVLSVVFHPTQPWVFSAGADGKIFLFQDI